MDTHTSNLPHLTPAPARPRKAPRCPRCRYDQSGLIAAWTDRCPLEGVCSECGLMFAWADVLNPVLRAEAWLIEHAEVKLGRALIRTIPRAAWPGAIWRAVEMRHPIVGGRLVPLALAAGIVAHMVVAISFAAVCYFDAPRYGSSPWSDAFSMSLWPYRLDPGDWDWYLPFVVDTTHEVLLLLATAVVTPLTFLLLGDSMRKAKVWPGHLVRCGLYGTAACGVAIVLALVVVLVVMHLMRPPSWTHSFQDTPIRWQAALAWLAGLLFMWCWWRSTVRHYLRLPRAGMVAAAMLVIAGLAVPTAYLGLWWVVAIVSR